MTYRDQRGDANGSNGQGEQGVELGVPTEPASVAEADILKVAFGPVVAGDEVVGFSVTITVTGSVSGQYMYAVAGHFDIRCGLTLMYRAPITEAVGGCSGDTVRLPDAIVRGSRVAILVPLELLPGGIRPGDVLDWTDAYTVPQLDLAGRPSHAPKLDYASTSKNYRIPKPGP